MNTPRLWPPPMKYQDELPSLREQCITMLGKSGRGLIWATDVTGKTQLLENTTGPVWVVWTGRWSSHLFEVPRRVAAAEFNLTQRRRTAAA